MRIGNREKLLRETEASQQLVCMYIENDMLSVYMLVFLSTKWLPIVCVRINYMAPISTTEKRVEE